jgi:glycosyltransferase involved in cell wall biosynthesis
VIAAARETEVLLEQLGLTEYSSIPLPIDEEKFRPRVDCTSAAQELGLIAEEDVVLFVGRLNEFKDPLTLVQAAPYVLVERPTTRFVIVGDGPQAPALRVAIRDLGLQEVVHLMGARRDVERFLALSKVFVALSPIENAWSMTIAEAMRMRVPCIITRAGRTEEVFTHMKNAYLIEPDNEKAAAAAILDLLSDAQKRESLIDGACNLLKQHGKDSERISKRTLDLYQEVLEKELDQR